MPTPPCDPIDFVPGPCESNAITQCIVARACELEMLNPSSIGGSAGLLSIKLDSISGLTVNVNDANTCLLAALQLAFSKAGVPFPIVPPLLPIPDFTDCKADLDSQIDETANDLGVLSNIFNIEFDENGLPTRIQA